MRVFLDTNVLVSAAATRGLCADVLRECLVAHDLVISGQLLEELRAVLKQKFRLPAFLISEYIDLLRRDAIFAGPGDPLEVKIKDKDDLKILSSALSVHADLFVTGDNELLNLGKVGAYGRTPSLEIVSPRGFWERLKK